jgi:hypothetical protein
MGNTSTGNHINLFGIQSLPPDTIKDQDYDKLIAWAKTNAGFIQFNHPDTWDREPKRNKKVGNYGRALYVNDAAFLSAADGTVKTISIISTVKGGHISGDHKHSTAKTHREVHTENFKHYKRFLNLGFRLSPAANQDTHWKNWGTVTAARTAVWADAASYEDLMKAFKANRVYATEDDEMVVAFQAEYKGKRYWMGETVALESDEDDVDLIVRVWQALGSDGDPTMKVRIQLEFSATLMELEAMRRRFGRRTRAYKQTQRQEFRCMSRGVNTSFLRSRRKTERIIQSETVTT